MTRDPLDRALSALADDQALPPLSPRLRAELERLEPVETARPLRRFVIAGLLSAFWMGGLLALLGLRRDIEPLPRLWMILYTSAWALTFLALSFAANVPPRRQVMPRSTLVGRLGLAAGIGFVGVGLFASRHVPGLSTMYEPTLRNIVAYGTYCVAIGLATASLPILIAAMLLRHSAPTGAGWLGMAVGASSGALGGLLLHLHCPIAERTHLGLVHGGIVLIAGALGAVALSRTSAAASRRAEIPRRPAR